MFQILKQYKVVGLQEFKSANTGKPYGIVYIAYEIDGTKTDHGLGYYDNCQVYMPSLDLLYSYDIGDYVRAVYATSKTTNQRYIKDLVKIQPPKPKSKGNKKRLPKKTCYRKPKI